MTTLLVVGLITAIQVKLAKDKSLISNRELIVAGIVGLLLGELLDVSLGYGLGLWRYVFLPYWSMSYWLVLPIMWTEFGIGVYVAWKTIRLRWLIIPMLCCVYEGYGIVQNSWHYSINWYVVVLGWIPLIITIIMLVNILANRKIALHIVLS